MKVLLKGLWSISSDLENYDKNLADTYLWINLDIGPDNEEGFHDFQVLVCTPEALAKRIWEPKLIRHMLIIRKYDLEEITKTINEYIEKCNCNTWWETAQKLSRYFQWEFEDYDPCSIAESPELD